METSPLKSRMLSGLRVLSFPGSYELLYWHWTRCIKTYAPFSCVDSNHKASEHLEALLAQAEVGSSISSSILFLGYLSFLLTNHKPVIVLCETPYVPSNFARDAHLVCRYRTTTFRTQGAPGKSGTPISVTSLAGRRPISSCSLVTCRYHP